MKVFSGTVFYNASSTNVKRGQQTLHCEVTGKRDSSQSEQDRTRLSEDKIEKRN
jgi:hypothetical protein